MDADRALQDYKIAHNLVTTGKGGLLSSEQLANLSTQLTKARIEVVENLRPEGDQRPAAPQLAPSRIEREVFKGVEQCTAPPIGEKSTPTRALTSLTLRTKSVKLVTARWFLSDVH